MKIRFCTLSLAMPLVVLAAACGSQSTGGSSNPGASTGSVATTPPTSNVSLSETGATELYPLMNIEGESIGMATGESKAPTIIRQATNGLEPNHLETPFLEDELLSISTAPPANSIG